MIRNKKVGNATLSVPLTYCGYIDIQKQSSTGVLQNRSFEKFHEHCWGMPLMEAFHKMFSMKDFFIFFCSVKF